MKFAKIFQIKKQRIFPNCQIISGNAWSFCNCLGNTGIPTIAKACPEMPDFLTSLRHIHYLKILFSISESKLAKSGRLFRYICWFLYSFIFIILAYLQLIKNYLFFAFITSYSCFSVTFLVLCSIYIFFYVL